MLNIRNNLTFVGACMQQCAVNMASVATNKALSTAASAIGYAVGTNNMSNAYARMTEKYAYHINRIGPNQASIEAYEPFLHQRIAAAAGEISIAATKVTALSMFTHGGICTVGTELGWMAPCETLSVTGLNQAFYNGVTWTAGAGLKAAMLAGENVVVPVANFATETFVNHPVNCAAALAIGGTLYSAAKDISAMHDKPTYLVNNTGVSVNTSTQKTFYQKVALVGSAMGKASVALALTAATFYYNTQQASTEITS